MTTFDLTTLDTVVSGNMGNVSWYSDSSLLNSIPIPAAFVTGDTTVFAVVSIGTCVSDPAAVVLTVGDALWPIR